MFQLVSQLNIQAHLLLVILCLHIELNKEVLPLLEKKTTNLLNTTYSHTCRTTQTMQPRAPSLGTVLLKDLRKT